VHIPERYLQSQLTSAPLVSLRRGSVDVGLIGAHLSFSFNPLADIGPAIHELDVLCFATSEKANRMTVQQVQVGQIQNDLTVSAFRIELRLQSRYIVRVHSPAQSEGCFSIYHSLNPQHELPL
jgi:hypothetical protein